MTAGIQIGRAEQGYSGPTRSPLDLKEPRIWTEIPTGRRWEGMIEKKSGDFCGLPPQPMGWSAPFPEWIPPAIYLRCGSRWTIRRPGESQPTALRADELIIDYDAWITSLADSMRGWMEQFYAFGEKMCGPAFDPENPPPQLLAAVGPKPLAIEPVMAMRQGNRYALGLTNVVDERLREFFPVRWVPPEPDFREMEAQFGEETAATAQTFRAADEIAEMVTTPRPRRRGRPPRVREE